MSTKTDLIAALTEFVKKKSGVQHSVVCTVSKAVDMTTKTCYCTPINGDADIFNVRLIADKTKDGFILIPKQDSVVVVTFESESSAYVSMVSQVDEIHLAGVNYGGLGKTADITTRLNNLENKVNALVSYTATHVHAGVTVGAGVTGVTATPVVGALTLTTQADISSTKVFHGDAT